MRILLLGSSGRIGSEIASAAPSFEVDIIKPSSKQFNITSPSSVSALYDDMPDLVINASAYTDVDAAENHIDHAYLINTDGPRLLAETCQLLSIPLIHISTDYVFSGGKNTPYVESDKPGPINIYGKSKLAGEEAIAKSCEKYIILRTSWLFGEIKNNFVKTILKLATEKSIVNVIENETSCPTASPSVANVILKIAQHIQSGFNEWGLYHYCGTPEINRYHYAMEMMAIVRKYSPKKYGTINAIHSSQFQTIAARPTYSAMNMDKLFSVFNIKPNDWRSDLDKVIPLLLKQ